MSDIERDLADRHDELWQTDGDGASFFPNGWAVFSIDMRLMTEGQRDKVWQASNLLAEAGVAFDTEFGGGLRYWLLDWSLSGAAIRVRPLRCLGEHEEFLLLEGKPITWAVLRSPSGRTVSYPFCSRECQAADEARRGSTPGWETLLVQEQKAAG